MNTCGPPADRCTACCKLVPVAELGVRSFRGCPHERNFPALVHGCAIYPDRPKSCQLWRCHYIESDWPAELRPDRCGVVVDTTHDMIRVVDDRGRALEMPAVQMWVAPGYETAYLREPVISMVLAIIDSGDMAVIWRYRAGDGVLQLSIFKGPDGQFAHTAPAAPLDNYSTESTEARLWRASERVFRLQQRKESRR